MQGRGGRGEGSEKNIEGVGQAGEQWVGSPPELPGIGVWRRQLCGVTETDRHQGREVVGREKMVFWLCGI